MRSARNEQTHEPRIRTVSRRQLLRVGGLGSLGLTLPALLRAEALGPPANKVKAASGAMRPIRSCILIFHYGGPSHIDTYDMKPNAPAEIRGQFGSIATSVPGIRVCEHLPQTASVMDRLAIVRSMHHPMTNHNAAAFTALCGRDPLKGDLELLSNDRNDPPCCGAILSATMRERPGLPTFVALPHVMYNVVQLPGQVAGFLGSAHGPFQVNADPSAPDFHMGELELPGDLSLDRLDHRASLLSLLDHQRHRALARVEAAIKAGGSTRPERTPVQERAPRRAWILATCTQRKPFASCTLRRYGKRLISARKTRSSVTVTVGTSSGKAFSWPGVWSRLAFVSSRFTTVSITDRQPTGTRTKMSSAGSRTIWLRPPTSLSQL